MDRKVMKLCELDHSFDATMFDDNNIRIADGFTIGRGKLMFWYISHQTISGLYRCFATDENGTLLSVRYVQGDKNVTIHYLNSYPTN